VQSALIDAGPCIALFDRSDKYHEQVKLFLEAYRGRLFSTWPVVTEVMHMLDFDLRAQVDFLHWLERGAITISPLDIEDLPQIIKMIKKYADRPMDLADATLLITANKGKINNIISIDADFTIYQTPGGKKLDNLLL